MATIKQVLDNFKGLDFWKVASESMVQNKENIEQYNREQLMKGVDKFGKKFYEYKSPLYADVKHRMNPLPGYGYADGKATGAFHEEITFRMINEKNYLIYSQDEKYKKLISPKMFGADIFGLTSESKTDLIDSTLQNNLVENVKKAVRL